MQIEPCLVQGGQLEYLFVVKRTTDLAKTFIENGFKCTFNHEKITLVYNLCRRKCFLIHNLLLLVQIMNVKRRKCIFKCNSCLLQLAIKFQHFTFRICAERMTVYGFSRVLLFRTNIETCWNVLLNFIFKKHFSLSSTLTCIRIKYTILKYCFWTDSLKRICLQLTGLCIAKMCPPSQLFCPFTEGIKNQNTVYNAKYYGKDFFIEFLPL